MGKKVKLTFSLENEVFSSSTFQRKTDGNFSSKRIVI